MKATKSIFFLLATLSLFLSSCEDLTDVNKNPNAPETVSSNFIMTYVLTNTGKTFYNLGRDGSKIGAAMQYMQAGTNENAAVINQYAWTPESWGGYYDILRNNQLIYEKGVTDNNKLFQGIALTMKSAVYGLVTDLYGDIPYSEALKAGTTGTFFPKYDNQADVYKGVLTDLKAASVLLSSLEAKDAVSSVSDVMYKGDGAKWKKFANSLRLRYCLRLANKKAEMSALGVDIEAEFKDAAAAAFASNADDASIAWLGTSTDNSAPGGPLNAANPNFLLKPGKTFVDKLVSLSDPRLQRWVQPVLRKWDSKTTAVTTKTVTTPYESYSVIYVPSAATSADTALYVGLPIGMEITKAVAYNKGNDATAYNNERNPYISFLHERYRKNTDPYVLMNLMTYSEVEFILAEAAFIGGFGVTDPADHYKKAIRASMDKAGVFTAASFNFDNYYAQATVNYADAANKQERIMEQKWISSWFGIQSWFDWRRTGFPALKTGEVAQYGPVLPIRYMYPPANLDPSYLVNYNAAVGRLGATNYIPSGQSKDHPYAKMWLLQGNTKPW